MNALDGNPTLLAWHKARRLRHARGAWFWRR
jgi:hypothetical protein